MNFSNLEMWFSYQKSSLNFLASVWWMKHVKGSSAWQNKGKFRSHCLNFKRVLVNINTKLILIFVLFFFYNFFFQRTIVVCAWGSEGAAAGQNDVVITQSAFPPDKVVDTLGAGDTFNAAFIYGQVKNWDLKKSLKFACVVAGRKIGQKGFRGLGDGPLARSWIDEDERWIRLL